jgi:glutaredoxin 3
MGPDGRCVLCRREDPSGASIRAPALRARSLVRVGLGVALLVSAAGAVILWTRRQDRIDAARSQVISFQVAAASAAPAPAEAEEAPPRPPLAVAERLAKPFPFTNQGGPPDAAAQTAEAVPDASATAGAARPSKQPTPEQIRAAIRRVPVSVYTTPNCPICASARAFLAANQISFVEKDVESNPGDRAELAAMNPNRTVPTFIVDGQVVVGFSPIGLARVIGARVERQLGVKLDVRVPAPR